MADASPDDSAHLEQLIATLRRRRRVLETQRARYDAGAAPAYLVLELEDIARELGQHEAELRRLRPGPADAANPYLGLLTFQEADAEQLPFADSAFDVVLSVFGVMFTPNQEQAAQELLRVCRPGGAIGLANWTPEGFIGQVFRTIGKYVPPPPGVKSPALWGTEPRLRELFGDGISKLTINRRYFVFRYHSAQHWLEVFRTYYGPMLKAFGALDATGQAGLARDLTDLLQRFNQGGPDTLVVPSEYIEVVATRA